jgi:hypothetical protein
MGIECNCCTVREGVDAGEDCLFEPSGAALIKLQQGDLISLKELDEPSPPRAAT